jgi:CheY-like chemotaxis protein
MRKKILIAEHEVAVSDSLERRLQMRGYTPMVCGDAATALATFDAHRPDLVIISLTLAGDAGREVCRGIRMRPLGALVPILFLGTGREEVRNVSEAIAAGADHFFRKPDALAELFGKVATYIGPGEEGPAGPEPPHAPVADERELLAALGRTDAPALAPSAEAASSGFFRAIRGRPRLAGHAGALGAPGHAAAAACRDHAGTAEPGRSAHGHRLGGPGQPAPWRARGHARGHRAQRGTPTSCARRRRR